MARFRVTGDTSAGVTQKPLGEGGRFVHPAAVPMEEMDDGVLPFHPPLTPLPQHPSSFGSLLSPGLRRSGQTKSAAPLYIPNNPQPTHPSWYKLALSLSPLSHPKLFGPPTCFR